MKKKNLHRTRDGNAASIGKRPVWRGPVIRAFGRSLRPYGCRVAALHPTNGTDKRRYHGTGSAEPNARRIMVG